MKKQHYSFVDIKGRIESVVFFFGWGLCITTLLFKTFSMKAYRKEGVGANVNLLKVTVFLGYNCHSNGLMSILAFLEAFVEKVSPPNPSLYHAIIQELNLTLHIPFYRGWVQSANHSLPSGERCLPLNLLVTTGKRNWEKFL